MFNEISRHKFAYAILIVLLVGHVIAFLSLWPSRPGMRIVAGSLSAMYFFWGILTHVKSSHLTKAIVKEYLFAALLAGTIIFLLTF